MAADLSNDLMDLYIEVLREAIGLDTIAPAQMSNYNHTYKGVVFNVTDGNNSANNLTATGSKIALFGFGGNDTLTISANQEAILSGGQGADSFVFQQNANGNIIDFYPAEGDKIDLRGTGITAFNQLTITQSDVNSVHVTGTGIDLDVGGAFSTLNSSNFLTAFGSGETNGNDVLTGSTIADVLSGLAGDDLITGLAGNDTLNGNLGNDTVSGGDGVDQVEGGQGNDYVNGNLGADIYVNGNLGDDTVEGGQGDDSEVRGGQGNDQVNGNLGNDTVYGDKGEDLVRGGQGNDLINGGDGNDFIFGDKGNDTLTGGTGDDTFYFAAEHGADVVTDFTAGTDTLEFSSALFANAAAVVAAFSGGVITTASGSITLTGVASLSASDILIS